MCQEDLDYTYFPEKKEHASWLPQLKSKTRYFVDGVYENIAKFIKNIADYYCKEPNETVTVLFNYDKQWGKDTLDYHYHKLKQILNSDEYFNNIMYYSTKIIDEFWDEDKRERMLFTDDKIIIVDIATQNTELKEICQKIVACDDTMQPVITYISLLKAYDREEMSSLIDHENKRQAEIRDKKEKEERAKKNLLESVSSWESLPGGLRYSYLFNYYPTTCDFEATEEEWDNRWLVWDFKNTPGKTSSEDHQAALEKAIPMVKQKLVNTFGEESLKYLTLVCIPASSQQKTKLRYEEFSNLLCNELGMNNAYSHITVVTAKEERRSGGTSIDTSKLSFDDSYFDGKYVLLFDDIITRGDSMRTFKTKMESLGAIVVGGLALGRTKHNR